MKFLKKNRKSFEFKWSIYSWIELIVKQLVIDC